MKKIVFIALFFCVNFVFGETIVSGIITENAWWTADKSPYILANDVVIAPDARLVIEPGVTILIEKPTRIPDGIKQIDELDSFTVAIKVYGAIYALATPTNPITIKGKDVSPDDNYTHWAGIYIDSRRTAESVIGFATISSAANGIWIKNGRPLIRNVLFEFNNVGLRMENKSSVRVMHCIFAKNYLTGIRILDSNPYIYNSIIVSNNLTGLWGDRKTKIDLRNNLFFDNGRNFADTDPLYGKNSKVNENGDSTDFAGNLVTDPIFAGTLKEEKARNSGKIARKPMFSNIFDEIADKRYFLSPFSPAIDAGINDKMFREVDGSLPDLGIWGGAEVIRF
jgi:hypothetical protein